MVSLEDLRMATRRLVADMDWDKYHAPRNLLLAMMRDVGRLSEIFQWRGEVAQGLPDFDPEEKTRVSEEVADLLLCAIRLADVSGVDLDQAIYKKLRYTQEHAAGATMGDLDVNCVTHPQ
eukprot:evm.model.scf_102.2 EVM.evm.TU.scf_102.2   scf_102:30718-32998(+)